MESPNPGLEIASEDQISSIYDEALLSIQAGHAARALEQLTTAFKLSYAVNNQQLISRILAAMGKTYLSLEQRARAEDCFTTALKMNATQCPEIRLSANTGLARAAQQQGNQQGAIYHFTEAAKAARELQEQTVEASLLNDLGDLQYEAGQTKDAMMSYARALEAARAAQSAEAEAAAYCGLAVASQKVHNPDAAALHVDQALLALRRVENRLMIRTIREKLISVMESLGISARLIDLEFTLVSAYSAGVMEPAMNTHIEIAQILGEQGQMDKALAHLEAARTYARQLFDRHAEARIVDTMAEIYEANGLSYMALSIHDEWVRTARDAGDLEAELHALESLAQAHQRVGQLDNAIQTLQRAILLAQTKCDRHLEAAYLFEQALIYLKKRSAGLALQILERAKKALPVNIDPALASDIDRYLSELRPQSVGGLSRRVMNG